MIISEEIIIAIISASFGTVISGICRLFSRHFDQKDKAKERIEARKEEFEKKKEEVYIAALDRLLQIKKGIELHASNLSTDEIEEIRKKNREFEEIAPRLRLFSDDAIFDEYSMLAEGYKRFAYNRNCGLFEESKWAFDFKISVLARKMQDSLGYREFNKSCQKVICPSCGKEHDYLKNCQCGMTFDELVIKANEIVLQAENIFSEQDIK